MSRIWHVHHPWGHRCDSADAQADLRGLEVSRLEILQYLLSPSALDRWCEALVHGLGKPTITDFAQS